MRPSRRRRGVKTCVHQYVKYELRLLYTIHQKCVLFVNTALCNAESVPSNWCLFWWQMVPISVSFDVLTQNYKKWENPTPRRTHNEENSQHFAKKCLPMLIKKKPSSGLILPVVRKVARGKNSKYLFDMVVILNEILSYFHVPLASLHLEPLISD